MHQVLQPIGGVAPRPLLYATVVVKKTVEAKKTERTTAREREKERNNIFQQLLLTEVEVLSGGISWNCGGEREEKMEGDSGPIGVICILTVKSAFVRPPQSFSFCIVALNEGMHVWRSDCSER